MRFSNKTDKLKRIEDIFLKKMKNLVTNKLKEIVKLQDIVKLNDLSYQLRCDKNLLAVNILYQLFLSKIYMKENYH